MFKKADFILALILIIVGFLASYYFTLGDTAGDKAVITVDGKVFGTYSLAENRVITINKNGHRNKVTIKNGSVSMTFSDCPSKDCMRQGSISRNSQSIICLPHKVVIEIQGGKSEYDDISG